MQYYYHPDHLGSSRYITNLDGEIVQHVEYVPFGEVFIEERNNSWNTPYLFNGKELDEETGLYYYGARYYNPRESIFLSVDPMFEKTMTPYQYAYQNPIRFIDFDGRMAIDHIDVEKNEDGTYTVVGGQANSDKNIYVVDKQGKRTGEVLGQMLTEYSFHREDGSAVTGTNINLNDKSGQNFFNNEIKNIGLFEYIGNAKGKEPLDFKHRGMNDKDEGTTVSQHHYRGMLFEGKIASARDIGNFAAGYVAAVHGFGWKIQDSHLMLCKPNKKKVLGKPFGVIHSIGSMRDSQLKEQKKPGIIWVILFLKNVNLKENGRKQQILIQ
nr:RHS repeat-associated core domain-containing protein [Apibacter mensalis]